MVNDFGAIGSGLPAAIGIAAARGDGKVMLIEGDGSLLMHIQELETIRRQGIRMLIAVMNDGGYGAEFHKFRANGIDPAEAIHGRGDLAGVATGFGLRGAAVTEMGRFAPLFREHQARQHRPAVGHPHRRPHPVARLSARSLRRGLGLRARVAAAFHAVVEELKLGAGAIGVGLLLRRHHAGAAQGRIAGAQRIEPRGGLLRGGAALRRVAGDGGVGRAGLLPDAGAPPDPAQAASPADSAKQSSVPIGVVFDMSPSLLPK